ncbi:hypothetical protein GCM10027565_08580 [Bordetella tumulicola]
MKTRYVWMNPPLKVSGIRKPLQPYALRARYGREGQCAVGAKKDEYEQMKEGSAPWVGAGMQQEPGHTWVGSALTGQRLKEPALLGGPMYEAHRSWQLSGQCRTAIIMYAAHNRIRFCPYCCWGAWGRHCGVQ